MIVIEFILHILLLLVSEVDLLPHVTIRELLRQANLIYPSDDPESLQHYYDELLNKLLIEQLQYFPNSKILLDNHSCRCLRLNTPKK